MTELEQSLERLNKAAMRLAEAKANCAKIQAVLLFIGSVAFGVWQGGIAATVAALCFSFAWYYGQE